MAEIVLDRKTFGALAIESRVRILKALRERRKTQSELASEMHMAVSTVAEHLDKLAGAGLIARRDEGHRWVYYELTPTGEQILSPQRSTSVFVFALSVSILMIMLGASAFYNTWSVPTSGGSALKAPGDASAPPKTLAAGAPASAEAAAAPAEETETAPEYTTVQGINSAAVACLVGGAFLLALGFYYWKRRPVR